jgi:thymidine phosphorylase
MNTSLPRDTFEVMLTAQGADINAFKQKLQQDSSAPVVRELTATRSGYVGKCDARIVGEVVHALGGGRTTRTDAIRPDVGVDRIMKPGYAVGAGLVMARVHADDEPSADAAIAKLETAFVVQAEPPDLPPLILETVRQ